MTQLTPSRKTFAEHSRNQWFVVPEHGTPFDALLDPAFWAHVAYELKPCDEITVHAEDGSYYGRLLVRDASRLYAIVAKLEYHDLDPVDVQQGSSAIPKGYEVKWRGPIHKWCVLRGTDVLKDGQSKDSANQWLREHLRTVGA
jgi:hypothetical protein